MAAGRRSPLFLGLVLGALLLVLIGLLVAFSLELLSFSSRIERRNEAMLTAVRENTATLDYLKQNILLLADDSNTARRELDLPARDYPILHPEPSAAAGSTKSQDVFLSGLDAILREHDQQLVARIFADLAASPELKRVAADQGLLVQAEGGNTVLLTKGGQRYFTITVDPISRGLRITDALGRELLGKSLDSKAAGFIQERMAPLGLHFQELETALRSLRGVASLPLVASALEKNGLTTTTPTRSDREYVFQVTRAQSPLLSVSLDTITLEVTAGAHRYRTVPAFAAAFPGLLDGLGLEQSAGRRVEAAQQTIEKLHSDKTFMLALSSRRIRFARKPRQDIDYFYYDFTDAEGKRIGSFGVQKKIGTIYLMDSDDVPITALKTLSLDPSPEPKKKAQLTNPAAPAPSDSAGTTPLAAPKSGALNVLLCGAHQNETDSLVVVHADRDRGRILLISVPRDLYYMGRKINAVYQRFGPEELTKEVADITGLPIRKYVVIDMYAFIDVVNIIGGVDVDLRSPLVDPTYRVRTNGSWGTLRYSAGIHHLDGIGALRVARSRHTSSDFSRAFRQQDILTAIRDKIGKRGSLDVEQLYNLVGVFSRYVDTNLTPAEMVEAFLAYRNTPISGHYVIDTANVLYQTYANIYYLGDSGKHLPKGFDKGAWIVLPKNDDWSLIRRYVERIIEGETP